MTAAEGPEGRWTIYAEIGRLAISALWSHKLRSFLTMLGVIFGVAAVIAMLAIGKGAEQEAVEQIRAFGLHNVILRAAKLDQEKLQAAKRAQSVGLSADDAAYIQEVLPYVEAVAPQNLLDKEVEREGIKPRAAIVGTTPAYLAVASGVVAEGRFLAEEDERTGRRVCVLGHGVARALFFSVAPLGRHVTIGGQRYTVVGVMAPKAATKEKIKIKSRDVDADVYVPLAAAGRFTITDKEQSEANAVDYHVVDEVVLKFQGAEHLAEGRRAIRKILQRRHHGVDDTEVIVPDELLAQSQATQRLFNLVMGGIAGLSLLVGGIGIMNIMLATVTERTKEIGLRLALGARQRDILDQFLIEAAAIAVVGGVFGIVLGVALGGLITVAVGWTTVITPASILVSFGVSAAVGIFFGYWPARRAARLDPITALRHE
jgi:putative ABC transport system permease protein